MITIVIRRLRAGVQPEEMGPLIERRAIICWALSFTAFALGISLCVALGITFDSDLPSIAPILPAWFAVGGMLIRRLGHDRLGGFLEAFGLIYVAGALAIFLTFAVAVISRPFQDETLAGWDAALGLDVRPLITAVQDDKPLSELIVFIYQSLHWQPLLLLAWLFATDRSLRAWRLVTAWIFGAFSAFFGLYLFPAINTYDFFGFAREDFPFMLSSAPWHPAEVMRTIKLEGVRHLSTSLLDGYTTFPSFHATAAGLFVYAAWPHHLLRWPVLAFNVAMIPATIIVGAHYWVDIIAGLAIAAFGLAAAHRLVR